MTQKNLYNIMVMATACFLVSFAEGYTLDEKQLNTPTFEEAVEACKELEQSNDFALPTAELRMECLDRIRIAQMHQLGYRLGLKHPPANEESVMDIAESPNEESKPVAQSRQAKDANRQAKAEAIEFCEKETASHNKEDCLDIVTPARFVDKEALSVCAGLPSHDHNHCLSAIVDKIYDPALIEECDEKAYHKKTECLLRWGMPTLYDLQPAFTVRMQVYSAENPPPCKYANLLGSYPEGGGCDYDGCWMAGGGCNSHGCWMAGGHCDTDGCVQPAPEKVCQ